MSLLTNGCRGALAVLLLVSACGDDKPGTPIDAPTGIDSPMIDAPTPVTTWRQVEHLGRPGINEALLITNDYLNGYNATAPAYTGVPAATLTAIVGEAKTVLKALYLGTCLLNGLAGFTDPQMAAKPGGLACAKLGGNIFTNDNPLTGNALDADVITGMNAYADRVFSQFVSDVMRIDTAVDSAYLTVCQAGAPADVPLLCGGRKLHEDVIDITYFYLIAGAAVPTGATTPGPVQNQVLALVADGVAFSKVAGENSGNNLPADPANPSQGHPNVTGTFPYSAAPL